MANNNTIEAGIKLDGEKEFKSAVADVGKELQKLKSESDLVKTTFDGQANSTEALSTKQDVLTRTLETYRQKETEVRKGLDHAKESYNNVGLGLQKLYGNLENATNKLNELKIIYGESSEEVNKQQKEVDKLSNAVKRGETNYESAAKRIQKWETDLNKASTETIKANRAVEENAAYLKEAKESANGCAESINEFGKQVAKASSQSEQAADGITSLGKRAEEADGSMKSTSESVDIFGQALLANLASGAISGAIEKLKEFAAEIAKTIVELDAGAHQLQASTGATEASMIKYRDVMQDIWADNFGEGFDDIAEAMSVINRTMGELDSSTMKEMSENAITLRDTFGFDYQESIRSVDMLMSQFGLNGQQAFNLIVQGAQQGLDKNGDLLDSINEYAVHYQQLGYSADEFFNSLKNGTDAGTFSVDKLGDAMKEYGIRSKDLANTTDEAFQAMGLNAAEMRNDFAKGGTSAREATDKVLNALFSMESEVKQNAAGVNMFGTMWEDLGKDGVKALMDVEGGINSAKDAMNELKKVKYDDIGSSLKTLGRTISEKFLDPIADVVLPTIKSGIDGITSAIDPAKSQMEQFLHDVISTNKELESSTENVQKVMANAQVEANTIQNLGNELLSLNDMEGKSLEQRYQLRSVVQSLSSQLPEIAEAYDQEAGKVKLTNDQIKELIENKRNLLLTNAAEAVEAEAINNIYKAQMNLQPAKEIAKVAGERIKYIDKEKKALQDIQTEYQKTGKMQEGLTPASVEGKISDLNTEIINLTGDIDKANQEIEKANEVIKENNKTIDTSNEVKKELEITTEELAVSEKEKTKATQESAEAEIASIESLEAKKEALEAVQSKFEETKSSIQQSLEQKINMFDVFNGGDDSTVEEINKNLESQLEGIKNYKANLEIIKDQVGKTIAPEFLQSIENMGLDGANMLKHMVATLNQDNGAELLKEMSDNFVEALDVTEEIAKNGAANETAMEIANGKLGSTKADFTGLKESINKAVSDATEGWSKLPDNTRNELDSVIQVAQDLGVKIPEGLAESIKSGETSPAEAINQMNSAISGTFEGLVSVAQEAGITIPDGIKDGIASGGDAAIKAYQELIQLLQQTGVESETNAQQSGKSSADKYAESMQAQSGTVKNAGSSVAKSGVEGINIHQMEFQNTGTAAMQSMANGISGGAYQVSSQAGAAASSANNSASLYYNAFKGTGENLALGLANGFIANAPAVEAAARAAVAKAVAGAKDEGKVASPSKVFRNEIGIFLPKGMELGIKDGIPAVVRSAREMARSAIDASRTELGINSPSKVFKEFGGFVSSGFGIGITNKKGYAVRASKKMSKEVYEAATSWMSDYKKTHSVSLAEESKFWKQIAKTVNKDSDSYKKALKNASKYDEFEKNVQERVGAAFDVSKTIKKGKKTVDKEADQYYGEITKKAKTFVKNQQSTNKISLQQQKYFWEQVKNSVGSGTQTYADACEQINKLNVNIKKELTKNKKELREAKKAARDYGISGSGLETYKTYFTVSAKAEMDYWDIIRKKKGLTVAERIEADQKYLEAKKSYNEQLKELEDDYADKCRETNENLADDIKEYTKEYNEAVADRKDAIKSGFGTFDEFKSESEGPEKLLANMESQVAGYALWEQQLSELSAKGIINDQFMEELRSMGPEAAATIMSMNMMSEEELKRADAAWKEKDRLAESQAVKENEALRKQTEEKIKIRTAEAQKELDAHKAVYDKGADELSKAISKSLTKIADKALTLGENATEKYILGLKGKAGDKSTGDALKKVERQFAKGLSGLPKAGKEIGKDMLSGILDAFKDRLKIQKAAEGAVDDIRKEFRKAADIHSPSRLFKKDIGIQIADGIGEGIQEGGIGAAKTSAETVRKMLEAAKSEMQQKQASLAAYKDSLNTWAGIEAINNLTNTKMQPQVNVSVDNSGMLGMFGEMLAMMQEYYPQMANQQIVMNNGALVGETCPDMGHALTMTARRWKR